MTAPGTAGARSRHAGDGTVPQHTTETRPSSLGEVCAARLLLWKQLDGPNPDNAAWLIRGLFGSGIDWFAATVRTR